MPFPPLWRRTSNVVTPCPVECSVHTPWTLGGHHSVAGHPRATPLMVDLKVCGLGWVLGGQLATDVRCLAAMIGREYVRACGARLLRMGFCPDFSSQQHSSDHTNLTIDSSMQTWFIAAQGSFHVWKVHSEHTYQTDVQKHRVMVTYM